MMSNVYWRWRTGSRLRVQPPLPDGLIVGHVESDDGEAVAVTIDDLIVPVV